MHTHTNTHKHTRTHTCMHAYRYRCGAPSSEQSGALGRAAPRRFPARSETSQHHQAWPTDRGTAPTYTGGGAPSSRRPAGRQSGPRRRSRAWFRVLGLGSGFRPTEWKRDLVMHVWGYDARMPLAGTAWTSSKNPSCELMTCVYDTSTNMGL